MTASRVVRPSREFSKVEQAFLLAVEEHLGQKDLGGKAYIWHLIRVALKMESEPEQIVALLHDIVEDTQTTLAELEQMFGAEVAEAIDRLSRRKGETYPAYIDRLKDHALAVKVKLADLYDNVDVSRLDEVGAAEMSRLYRYLDAIKILEAIPNA